MNTKLTVVYYNCGKPNMIRVFIDATMSDLKDQLNQINVRLNYGDTKKSGQCGVLMSINSYECVKFI